MKFAVIATSGTQHQVEEGKEILVDRIENKTGDKLTFDPMLFVDGDTVKVGAPTVTGCLVTAEVISHERGKKIRVAKYTAKSRSRKVKGHRSDYTRLKITSIT